jgi:hypothetical protein
MQNLNSPKYLEEIKLQVLQVLDGVEIAPSAPILTGQAGTTQIPGHIQSTKGSDPNEGNPDVRHTSDANKMAVDA